MKILSMTATFGKLEHQSLTLRPGLNIIEAPNEWGKSTWCAFLAAMLYGVDTRERSTTDRLADKEHYAPWSGSPMAGRMDIRWNGRDITIERSTRGRIPMGHFRAYETPTGLDIPELTAANCGAVLLGVERSVFLRTAFLRLADMPVTQDDALRTRLNALVTTGDESNTATMLGSRLRELKNSCRYNRTGLLPQAEAEKAALEQKLEEINALLEQSQQLRKRLQELEDYAARLENHRKALEYSAARENEARANAAAFAREEAACQLAHWEQICAGQPPPEQLQQQLQQLKKLQSKRTSLLMQHQMISVPEDAPAPPAVFQNIPPENAAAAAEKDAKRYKRLRSPLFLILALFSLLAVAVCLLSPTEPAIRYMGAGIGIFAAILFAAVFLIRRRTAKKLAARYGSIHTAQWLEAAEGYASSMMTHRCTQAEFSQLKQHMEAQIALLEVQLHALTAGEDPQVVQERWQACISAWENLAAARREYRRSSDHAAALEALLRPAQPPELPDTMTYTAPETARMMADTSHQLQQLQLKLGQCQGRIDQLGSRKAIRHQLEQATERIRQLEDHYAALTLAQQTLSDAREELQRRFAPQITAHARRILSRLTDHRYERLTLDRDLNLLSGAANEDVLHGTRWRSDGTADQLYLALRLAVSHALIPDAPLILDDALVRFDDIRLKAALDILKEEAQHKQVILFTCQSREKNML